MCILSITMKIKYVTLLYFLRDFRETADAVRVCVCMYVFFFFELLHGLVSRTLAKPFVDLTPFFLQTQFLKRNFCKNWALTNQIIPLFTSFFVRDELNNLHIKHNILIILPFLLKLKINFNETQKFDSKLLEPNISQGKLL